MVVCPLCEAIVDEFKKNCHIIPRAFLLLTKNNGQNIQIDLKDNTIKINQSDEMGDYWCERCEAESSLLDSYGANVLIHKKKGKLTRWQGNKAIFQILSQLDYLRFKKFILSIVIRDHLYRKCKQSECLLTDEIFDMLKRDYSGQSDETLVVGNYLVDKDPMSKTVFSPVNNKNKTGVNFQLLNFGFQIYFSGNNEVKNVALANNGQLFMLELEYNQIGTYETLDEDYLKIFNADKNQKQIEKIRKKYD